MKHLQVRNNRFPIRAGAILLAALALPLAAHAADEAALLPTAAQDGSGPPADLLQVCGDALRSNAKFAGQLAEYRAMKESVPQARAYLLPQIGLFGDYAYYDESIDGNYYGIVNIHRDSEYTHGTYGAHISQTVFNTDQFYNLDAAELRVAQAGFNIDSEQGELLVGVASAYFALLANEGNYSLAQAKMSDLEQELNQTRGRAEAGLATSADLALAEAGFQVGVADKEQAGNSVVGYRARLTVMTGEQYGPLKKLPADLPLEAPDPPDEKVWIERALARNADIKAKEAALEAARSGLTKAKLKRLPKVAITGTAYSLDSSGGIAGARDEILKTVGVNVYMPLFTGGQITSGIREAEALVERADAALRDAKAQTVLQTRLAFLNTTDGLRRIVALKRAVDAANAAVDATNGGFEAGTRTYADVLSAIEHRYSAQTDYALARYTFLVESLKLKQSAGMLLTVDLAHINDMLEFDAQDAPPADASPNAAAATPAPAPPPATP